VGGPGDIVHMTVSLAVPILVLSATWEVYVAPHLVTALVGAPN
jgi:hypothetical protein